MKKFLKLYGAAVLFVWAFVGTGGYLNTAWDCDRIIRTSDVPDMEELRNRSAARQAVVMVSAAQRICFGEAVDGWKKTIKALTGKDPLGE